MTYFKILLFCTISLFFISCTEQAEQTEAVKLTIAEINQEPGYAWFEQTISDYTPNPETIAEIKTKFDNNTDMINIFVKPTCTCQGTHVYFPNMIKVLREAGINESNYTIYSMSNSNNHHPYQSQIVLRELPSFVLFKDNKPVYSLMDTIELGNNPSIMSIESALLEALNK